MSNDDKDQGSKSPHPLVSQAVIDAAFALSKLDGTSDNEASTADSNEGTTTTATKSNGNKKTSDPKSMKATSASKEDEEGDEIVHDEGSNPAEAVAEDVDESTNFEINIASDGASATASVGKSSMGKIETDANIFTNNKRTFPEKVSAVQGND